MSKKVLFVHDGPLGLYKSQAYGIHYKNELVERYSYFGKEVTFLMRSIPLGLHELDKYSKIDHSKFNFIGFPNFKSVRTRHKKKNAKTIINKAVEEHDIIIVRLPSAAGVLAFKEAKRLNKPVLVEFVACVYDALWNYDWRGKLLAHYKLKQYQSLMKDATHTIYVTNEFLQSRYPSSGKSIGCSDVELLAIDESALTTRIEKIKRAKEPLKLATVAAIDVIYKGQDDVIKAIAALKKQGVYYTYDIIGQGNSDRLQRLIDDLKVNDLITIVGAVPHKQVFDILKEVDIYVQSSLTEGLPRAVIEAMSVACPVIGTDAGGIPELIAEECTYPKGDIESLTRLLSEIDQAFLVRNAKLNFEKAKEYEKVALENRRVSFYNKFLIDSKLDGNE